MSLIRMKKKGMGWSMILFIILVILGFFAYLSFYTDLRAATVEEAEGASCRMMINFQDLSDTAFVPTIQNACATIDVNISLDGKDKDETLKVIADTLAEAWWVVNEGRTENLWSKEGGVLASKGIKCLTLYHIYFTDVKEREFNAKNLTRRELYDFMRNHQKSDEFTYHQYFQYSGGTGTYEMLDKTIGFDGEYTASIISPDVSWFKEKFDDTSKYSTVVVFGSLGKTQDKGCEMY